MKLPEEILDVLEGNFFKVSTDTRVGVSGTVFFALKGENFDGSTFISQALSSGAILAVTQNKEVHGEKVIYVDDVLGALQEVAKIYRSKFDIPILAIGGSNGKTTTRELVKLVLATKYKVHSSVGNLNNHIGLPISILSMDPKVEIGIFEIGANHPGEHLELLKILKPTHVLVTNNGLDHLEGFGSPSGVRSANKEIYDWARENGAKALVNESHIDQMEDSEELERTLYGGKDLEITSSYPLSIKFADKEFITQLAGDYNLENIYSALACGLEFGVECGVALGAISKYLPDAKRSQLLKLGGNDFILDCYNANPSSMSLSLESFSKAKFPKKGVVLGDMLELGSYSGTEHKKIVGSLQNSDFEVFIFIGPEFKKALSSVNLIYQWFPDSEEAREWFRNQDFSGFTFLLKGSRGMRVERVVE